MKLKQYMENNINQNIVYGIIVAYKPEDNKSLYFSDFNSKDLANVNPREYILEKLNYIYDKYSNCSTAKIYIGVESPKSTDYNFFIKDLQKELENE